MTLARIDFIPSGLFQIRRTVNLTPPRVRALDEGHYLRRRVAVAARGSASVAVKAAPPSRMIHET